MSRTIRRKNYENQCGGSWNASGRKLNGVYQIREYVRTPNGYWQQSYRAPRTKREHFEVWRTLHGESSHANAWSPSRYFRQFRMSENRMINKTELAKWLSNSEYEPLFECEPRSHLWDWS